MDKYKEFHKKHKYLYLLIGILGVIMLISGLYAFDEADQGADIENPHTKEIQNSALPEAATSSVQSANSIPSTNNATDGASSEKSDVSIPRLQNDENSLQNNENPLPSAASASPTDANSNPESDEKPGEQTKTIHATLRINGKNATLAVKEGSTAFDLMVAARDEGYMNFTYKDFGGDLGYFIESINGLKSTKDYFWIYYINGAKANAGVSNYTLKSQDVITWNYEKKNL